MYLHCGSREKRKLFAVCADAIPAFLYWRRAKVRACPLAAAYNPGHVPFGTSGDSGCGEGIYRNCAEILIIQKQKYNIPETKRQYSLKRKQGRGKQYPGLVIYAVATYTFCKIVFAAVNMVRARKRKESMAV